MGEFHRGLNINPVATLSIGESYQARVRYVPASIQKKEIAIADRKFETLRVGSESLQQRWVDFFSPSQPCEFPIIAKERTCH
jgi:hypothetical protein